MKKYLTLLVGILIATTTLASAPDTLWTRTYGGTNCEESRSIQQTKDGGFVITGFTYSFGVGTPNYPNVYLIRTNSSGDTLWTKVFGGTGLDIGWATQQTYDGGFIITGYTKSFGAGNWDVYLIRTDSLGDTIWTKTFGGTEDDWGSSVQQTSDSGFIIVGGTCSFGYNVYLIRTNSSGDILWTKVFGGTGGELAWSVQQTQDSGFIITGSTNSFGAGGDDVYLIKINSSGDTLWTKTYGGTDYEYGASVQQVKDGGFIIAGWTNSFGMGIPNYSNVYIIRTDSFGNTVWTKTYGGIYDDCGYSVQQTQDSGFIIAGLTGSYGSGVYVLRTDFFGDTIWTKTIGGTVHDGGYSVQQTEDGGYIIAGYTGSYGAGTDDVYLIRLGKETGVEEKLNPAKAGSKLKIEQNPFSKSTTISYAVGEVSQPRYVSLSLYDIAGKCVKTLVNEQKPAGTYNINLNANELKTGIYFLTLSTDTFETTKKLILIK
ncbi:MAG: T9SS type A sorting domain-containing protein [bacterium]|nr:T9SS type A sorting domain-containing protein [bacterium]